MAKQEKELTPEQFAAKEKQKKIAAGVLLAVFCAVMYWQDPFGLFGGTVTTATTSQPIPNGTPKPKTSPTPVKPGEQVVFTPLNNGAIDGKYTPLDGIARNIFVYPTPTPPPPPPTPGPPPPPPPTPPVILVGVNPQGVIGRTGDFSLTVTGMKFPADSRVYIDGREIATTLIDESHLRANITAEMIRNPGNLGVQVRSASDAKMFSNQLSLNVAEPPRPNYRFVGLIVGKQGSVAILKAEGEDEVINVQVGTQFGTPKKWKVTGINSQRIEILDSTINVAHVINFTGEAAN